MNRRTFFKRLGMLAALPVAAKIADKMAADDYPLERAKAQFNTGFHKTTGLPYATSECPYVIAYYDNGVLREVKSNKVIDLGARVYFL